MSEKSSPRRFFQLLPEIPIKKRLNVITRLWLMALIVFSTQAIAQENPSPFTLKGRFVVDQSDVGTSGETRLSDLRLKPSVRLNKAIRLGASIDLADNDIEILTLNAKIDAPIGLLVGQSKVPFSLEITSSSLHTSFVNRPLFSDIIGGVERQLGVIANWTQGPLTSASGLFYEALDDNEALNSFVFSNRSFLKFDDRSGHFGLSYRYRNRTDANGFSYDVRDAAGFIAPDIVTPGDEDHTVSLDLFWQTGQWSLSAEAGYLEGQSTDVFGANASLGWFLHGKRGYDPEQARYASSKVDQSVFEGGWGALEFTLRSDYAETNNDTLFNPVLFEQTVGVNWHLSSSARLLTNYRFSHQKRDNFSFSDNQLFLRLQLFL